MHIAQQRRDIRVGSSNAQEDACVPCIAIVQECHHGDTNDGNAAIQDDDESTLSIVVSDPSCAEHPDCRTDVWWEGKNLRHGDRVAEVSSQDDG